MLVRESIAFERKRDPKKSLGVGLLSTIEERYEGIDPSEYIYWVISDGELDRETKKQYIEKHDYKELKNLLQYAMARTQEICDFNKASEVIKNDFMKYFEMSKAGSDIPYSKAFIVKITEKGLMLMIQAYLGQDQFEFKEPQNGYQGKFEPETFDAELENGLIDI